LHAAYTETDRATGRCAMLSIEEAMAMHKIV